MFSETTILIMIVIAIDNSFPMSVYFSRILGMILVIR